MCDYLISKTDQDTKFELEFIKDLTKGKETILLSSETNKYDYDIFSYNGTVNISINGVKITLREALLTNKITIEEILEKANKDVDEYKTITKFMFADGNSNLFL